jgi:chemotaxis protein methyltransferase CheR
LKPLRLPEEGGGTVQLRPAYTMDVSDEKISPKDYERLRELIYSEIGICLGAEKRAMLEGRIRRRLKELTIPSYKKYCNYLFTRQGQKAELINLLDVVTTNKTDFFREPRHFEFLTSIALPKMIAASANRRPLLVWSAGCSTGEEPYTLAMVLNEFAAEHPGFSFRLLATDVSTIVLRKAALAIYSGETIQPVPPELRVKYFLHGREPSSSRVRIVPELRCLVEFRRLNLMENDYNLTEKAGIIFCRNVIIYFDRPTQQRILSKLTRYLAPGGYLFVGHSETLHELDLPLTQVAPALYRRADAGI